MSPKTKGGSSMKIYVIEDNTVYNEYVCNLLKKGGFKTEQAYHLNTAKKLLTKIGDDDIVFADLRLPEGDSIELLRWMRKNEMRHPFIVMTNYGEVGSAVESMKLGSKDYIQKPLLEDKLLPLIRSIQEERGQTGATPSADIYSTRRSISEYKEAGTPCRCHTYECADTWRKRDRERAYRATHPCPKQTV